MNRRSIFIFKVIIADDEKRICQLINALVDWNSINLEVAGIAENGIEAASLVTTTNPHILITDIRMPGISGIELIKKVKEVNPKLEIIIISGYAHFSYAQTAMKYGVEYYLLKPINKDELTETLKTICDKLNRIQPSQKMSSFSNNKYVDGKSNAVKSFFSKILQNKSNSLSFEEINRQYSFKFQEGQFQAFCIKIDYNTQNSNSSAANVVLRKACDLIYKNVSRKSFEYLLDLHETISYGIINYAFKDKEHVHRVLRDCLNQLIALRNILGDMQFTISLGNTVKDTTEIYDSVNYAKLLIDERIFVGTGHLIKSMPDNEALQEKGLLKIYTKDMLHAIENLSSDEGLDAVNNIKNIVNNSDNTRGYEVFDLIISAGNLFLMQINHDNRKDEFDKFTLNCSHCYTVDQLFSCLINLQNCVFDSLIEERKNEQLRPVRNAKRFIKKHFNEQITLEQVSDEIGLNSSYFSVLFKKETGDGFAKYLINIRIDEAKNLLRDSNLSVSDICRKVGYNDVKHFSNTFSKITGLKPAEYRKLYG